MCGLAGLVFADPRRTPTDAIRSGLEAMLAAQAHRGPDGEAIAMLPGAALGHRRLAVIDLSERAAQPMALRCRTGGGPPTAWIVFNGEIYNYLELRGDLAARGHEFGSDSDTETILHLYEERGIGCLEHLRGMFAFALWDAAARRLVLARDRMGEKPLYYRLEPEGLAFASEIKALSALTRARGGRVDLARGAIVRYLTLKYVPGPGTAVEGVLQLPPGCALVYEGGRAVTSRYWSLPQAADVAPAGGEEDLREALRATIEESVRLRMRSDVPLGLFLSGGLDSGIMAATMARAARASGAAAPIRAFTAEFGRKDYDEVAAAAAVARAFGADHRAFAIRPTPRQTVEMLPELAWMMDQPFADSSALAVHHLSAQVRSHVTVALSGDGGDELFLGYDRYRAHRLADRIAGFAGPAGPAACRAAGGLLRSALPGAPGRRNLAGRARRFFGSAGLAALPRNDAWITCVDGGMAGAILSADLIEDLAAEDPLAAVHDAYAGCGTDDPLLAIQRADLLVYLPDDILRKVDLATMAHGLESRAPLLDHHVVELAMRIPVSMKLRRGRGKAILRSVFGPDLPPSVARGRKAGFGLPIDHWLRDDLSGHAREVLTEPRTLARGLLQRRGVERLLAEHRHGAANHEDAIWALLMLEHWLRAAMDGAAGRRSMETPRRAVTEVRPA